MSTRHLAPTSQWKEPGSGAALGTFLYLRETAADVFEFDSEGPADAVFVETSPDVYEIDTDPTTPGAIKILEIAGTIYLVK